MDKAELSAKLLALLEQKKLKEKLEKDLAAVNHELEEKSARLKTLAAEVEKEWQDVARLEKNSLTALLYTLWGNHEQKLEQERQEFLAIELAYEELQHRVDVLTQEQTDYAQQLTSLVNVEVEYETILLKKEQLLLEIPNTVGGKLLKLLEEIAAEQQELREINEALLIGYAVLTDLEQLNRSLNDYLAYTGSDFIALGEARLKIYDIQDKMALFNRELADIKSALNVQIDMSKNLGLIDVLFGNFVTQWVMEGRVENSLSQVRQAQQSLQEFLQQLEHKRATAEENLQKNHQKRLLLIKHG